MGPDWPLKPSGIARGGQFRLIVVTSGTRNATSTNIDDYNTHVKNSVRGGHSAIRAYSDSFRALGSTAAVDARDNTGTRNTGVPIYWLNGNKVADNYADFYDGGWDDETNPRNQSGNAVGVPLDVWTGSSVQGTEFSEILRGVLRSFALGSTDSRGVAKGRLGTTRTSDSPMSGSLDSSPGSSRPLYGLSPIFEVRENPEITGFSGISAPLSASAGYAANETIIVRVAFSETVVVTETPYIVLNIGGRARRAVYTSGSGTSRLDFAYTVQAADFDSDGVNVCASAVFDPGCRQIQLDGGTIVATSDGLAPALTLPELDDQADHKVDGTPVTIDPGLGPISRPGDPAMGIVPADWALRPAGLNAGDKFRLLFVTNDKRDATSTDIADYNSFVQSAAAAGHAAIRGYSAGFRALASTESVDARDNTATTGTGVPIYWLNSSILADDNADLYDGGWANESQRTNERGTTTGIDTSVVWTGSTDDGRKSAATGCSGASTALGAAGCNDDGRLGSGVINPLFNGNPLVGAALSEKSRALPLYGMSQVLVLTVIPAKASSARIVSRPASGGTYAVGETVAVELGFGEEILVRGTPQFELELDSGKVVARYASGSGTGTLRFEYVVRIGDHTARIEASLDEDGETALRLGGATITDARGEAVDPGTPALANNAPNQKVEARPPAATGVSMASSPASGDTYGVGETVTVRLAMREDVTVVLPGRPHVWLEVGGAVRRAEYSGPVGSATRALEFSYTVQEGDLDTDGVRLCSSDRPGIDCGRIHLNGGTIRGSRGGLDAELGTPNQGAQAGHKVDAVIVTPPVRPATACTSEIRVPEDWALKPSGVNAGDSFRLIFITSSGRWATPTGIDTYNQFVQGRANAGHRAIRPYGGGFRAVASTGTVHARDNACATGTGVRIHWLNGSKVADNYADFFDNSWDDETNLKNESGNARSIPRGTGVWTGSQSNGTISGQAYLGTSERSAIAGSLNNPRYGPFTGILAPKTNSYPLYGLSQVFKVPALAERADTTAWSIVSTPAADNTYRRGEAIEVAVDFSEAVRIVGEPVINLAFGDNSSNLAGQVGVYLRGSGTSRLVFGYQVAPGIRDTTGFQFSDKPIELRGGSIRAVSDNVPVVLTIPAWSALTPSQNIDGRLDALTGGICERTQQVRDALVAAVQENDAAVTDCSLVTAAHLAGITGTLELVDRGIEALKPGDFAGVSGVTQLNLNNNALSALPAGVFEGLDAVETLTLRFNALGAGSLADGVFEPLDRLSTLALHDNPGGASFLPLADAGADLVLDAGETATLGGPGTGRDPWGMNADHRWVEVDADGNEVAERTEGLAAANVARPRFTAPALAEERVLRYRFTVQGRGHDGTGAYSATDTVTLTVRAAPAVTAVALTSAPRAGATYRAGERIEVSVTFSAPVTVTGKPRIVLNVGASMVELPYARHAGPALLVFGYTVPSGAMDEDGVEVQADAILLRDGTIAGVHGGTAMLGHDAVAADAAHRVNGSAPALTGGVCERTPQVRDALVAKAQGRDAAVTNCMQVTAAHLAAVGALPLDDLGITALKAGDFEGLSALGILTIGHNALTALPAGIFDGAESVHSLYLNSNALAEGVLADGVFEPLKRMSELRLGSNPGSASFVPRADAGEDLVLHPGETATLGGPGTGRDPWGTNADYAWVEVDAEGNEVAERTAGLAAADVARPGFTAPALAEERVLRYRLTVTGKGAATTGTLDRHRASDTVTVTVRAAPLVTAVALTSAPQAGGRYRRGERIEVSVTFSQPVTVSGKPAMTPTIGLEVGTAVRRAGYFTRAAPNVLVFGYTAIREDVDDNGIAVPENGIALEGATITGSRGTAALLGHGALAADTAHRVDGGQAGRTGGVCGRTEQVRDALVAKAKARAPSVIDCSQVTGSRLAAMTGTLQLGNMEIAALKSGDFEGLGGLEVVVLSGNALGALPERVLEPLTGLTALDLSRNPGSAGFLPRADAGADVAVSAGGTVTLGGPGTGRDPWGTNADYRWVEVDADGNEVAAEDRTVGLSGETAREARLTAPALTEERVLRYRLAVQGRGHNGTDAYSATDTVAVTVRAAPTVTAVALTSVPQNKDEGYRAGERIEVAVTFSAPVTVTGVPRIGLAVGTQTRRAFFVSKAGPAVLLFSYAVAADEMDEDGIAVPANGLRLAGGTIVDGYDAPAFLDHDAVAADAAHKVDGSAVVLTGGVCERTPQVRDALVAAVAGASDCSEVDDDDDNIDELAGIEGTLRLEGLDIAALKPGDFAGLSGVTRLYLNDNALSALPAGVFDGLGAVTRLRLNDNALGAGSLEDGVFEPLTGVSQLDLRQNPGSASFLPKADAGEGLVLRAGESATLGGPGTGGGPWGMNVDYTWVEIDADDNPVADAARTEGLSAADVARPGFTAPALAPERVVRYRLAVQGRGYGDTDAYTATDTVTVTVRAAPLVTGVALTSLPRADATYREGETIEVSVTFSTPVTVTGPPAMTPTIGLAVGTEVRRAAYARNAGPAVLVFGYAVAEEDRDEDGIAVPANGILLADGTIVDAQGGAAALGHDAVAADVAHQVNGMLDPLIGGVCERTPQVREALVVAAQENRAAATNCSLVTTNDLAGITRLRLNSLGIAALKPGDFAGLSGVGALFLPNNELSALPAGVFDGLGPVTVLDLSNNALGAGSLEDGVFEPLTRVFQLDLSANPGDASFVPKADAGEDLVLRAGESATLGGPGTGGGPWGMNVDYTWVEVDADDNPVADLERTEGLSATDVARPGFTAPALAEERVLRYRFTVQGLGHGNTNAYTATDTVTVTVRAAPAVTAVALTSAPQNRISRTYRAGERIEVSVTFSAPVTVTGPPAMTPTIGLEVGTVTWPAAYLTKSAPHVLVFGYTVTDADRDLDDGIAVPANGILLAGGAIADVNGGAAALAHDAVAADAAHKVDGSAMALIGGVCDRTPEVRDVLVWHASANDPMVTHCSHVGDDDLAGITGALQLSQKGIAALKPGDFEGLTRMTGLDLSNNALTALPAGVFEPLTGLTTLDLSGNPGSASFLPTADSGSNPVLRAGETATLGGAGTGGGPWGTNVEYAWVEVDAEGNPVVDADRAEGLSATDEASPNFTAPALAAERALRYRFTVTGKGAATEGDINLHRASDTVTVTVRAAPAVTAVALTSAPLADGEYRRGETIEVSVTFSTPVTVTGPPAMTPTIGLDVGTVVRRAEYVRNAGPAVLVFGYAVAEEDRDEDGIAVPANGILLADGTIVDAQGGAAALGHDAVAADVAHQVNGMLDPLIGGVCERTPQVREALVVAAQENRAAATNCSLVTTNDLAGITRLRLNSLGIAALKPGDFAGLSGVGALFLPNNELSALPAGVFDGLGPVTVLDLSNNALGAGSLEDGVFEPLTRVFQLDLSANPGDASFVPKADAGEDLVLRAGEAATLGGPGTGGGPWGTNVDYRWVEVDAEGNPVAEAERTEDLSAANVASPVFTAPALTAERVLRYRFTVQGLGHGNTNAYTATDTITVTVRAAPAVTAVALTSVPQAGATYRSGETIEVSVTFSAPVTVTGPPAMTPTIGLEVGTETRPAAYARNAGPAVLLFSYAVTDADTDTDGVAVPADGILLAGGTTIAGPNGVALLGHDAVAADAAHMVDGSDAALTGGVCDRTPQVRDALVAAAKANDPAVTLCSQVGDAQLKLIDGTLQLAGRGIVALKAGDFAGLTNVELTSLDLSGNTLSALPAAVFDPLTSLTALHLNSNALAEGGLPDGVFEKLPEELTTLDLRQNPGSASFVPRADAGEDLDDVRAREVATLDGSGTHGGPWGTNVTYEWVEVDAQGNEVAASARTEGLSATNVASPDFTAPVLTEERVLHYRLTVTGQGAATRGAVNRHSASATVQVTVRAGPALIGVAVTPLPPPEHYGIDKEIVATASFGEAVTVTGAPVLALDLGGVRREATFDRMNGTAKLVFVYTVQEGDPEAGIGFPENPVSLPAGSVIRTVEAPMAPGLRLAATPPAVRIDGVRPALDGMELPEVLGLTLKLIYHEALDEDSVPAAGAYTVTATSETVPANLPVTAVAVKGNTVTLTLARAPGVSQMVTMTYNAPASNPVRDLAGNKAGALTESQKVNSVPTVSVGAVYPKVAPGLGDAEFRVTVSQAPASDLEVMLSFEQADEYIAETTATITIPAGRASATRTFGIANDYTLASGALTATIAGVGDGYATAPAPGNAATVQVVVANPPFIVKWDKDAYTVTEGEDVEATVTLRTAAGVPKPRNDYHVALISLGDSAVAGDDYPDVSLTLAVQPADWKADGAGFAASVTVSVATVNDSVVEADERFHLAVASSIGQLPLGLECPAGLRNVGGATSCSTAVTIEDDDFGVTGVTVTSMPQKASDTYGARENIEFAVAFNQPVTVTGAPTFSFVIGTTTRTATWYAGSGTDTLLFSYAVAGGTAGDLDTNGISWLSGWLGNAIGIVQAGGTSRPTLAYAAQLADPDHKVDGRTAPAATATVTVAVTSAPLLTASGSTTEDTYGRQETIEIAVTASEAVEVVGDPVFRFTIGTEVVRAIYDRTNSTATSLVFTYEVKMGDMGPDGIAIGDGTTTFELDSNDRIRTAAHRIDIDRSHTAPGTLSSHKVDGSQSADSTAPALVAQPDGATVFTDQLTLTYDEALDEGSVPAAGAYEVTATNGGVTTPLPVSAVAVDGREVTLTLATPAVFGQTVTLTYTAPATNPLQDLFGNDAGALTNHPVTNKTIVLPVVSISAVHPKAAPLLADAQFRLTASPAPASDLEVTLKITQTEAYLASTEQTVTIPAGDTSATGTFPIAADYSLAPGALTATVKPGGQLYVPAPANAATVNAATVQVVMVNPPIVAQWAENEYEVAEGESAPAGENETATLTLKTAAGVPKPRVAYKVKVFTTNSSAVAGDDFTAVSGDPLLTIEPTRWTADGDEFSVSVPVTVETLQDLVLEGEERFRLQVSAVAGQAPLGLECPSGLRDLGGTGRCATEIVIDDDETLSVTKMTPVRVTSAPATGETYLGGEKIEFTVGFTAPVTVTPVTVIGAPTFTFLLGEATREADYTSGSDTNALVFHYTVQAGEIDTDGISWEANALALGEGGTVRLTTTDPNVVEDAALEHPAQPMLAGHRVDAVPPGLVEDAPTTMTGTVLTLVYDEKLDESSQPAVTAYTLTAGSVTSHPTMVGIAGSTVTLTFGSAPADEAEVTLAYTAPVSSPVKDAAGNPAPEFTSVLVLRGPVVDGIEVSQKPTGIPADRYGYTEAQLSSNVLGLRRWKLHERKAHGAGAVLTFTVVFDRDVKMMGTGELTLKLDLWGETRLARYVGGSGSDRLTFTWGPVLTGDNDFDGIDVMELVVPGTASIVDDDDVNRKFVAEAYGGKHFPEHKVFGGFHEMRIVTTGYAVEGESYGFRVMRDGANSHQRNDESHYVLVGITDSAFPGTPALGRHDEGENGPGGRAVTFRPGAPEGRRAKNKEMPISVTPPDDEGPTEGRRMTIALHATHFTVLNEAGELAHRIYMPRNLEGVTVPVRAIGTARAGAAPAIVGTPAVSAPQRNGAYAAEERIEAQVAFDTAVIVDQTGGSPTLAIALAGTRHDAAYVSGSGSATLRFALKVPAGAAGAAAARAIANGLVLNGATVRDAEGNDAVLEFGENPRIASLAIGAAPGGDGTWDAGESVEVAVTFEEPVTVDTEAGTPTLRARVGAVTYAIPYASGTGTDTLTFSITREDGAAPAPTVIVEGDSLVLNGGAIVSTAGLVAKIGHPGAARAGFAAPELPSIGASDAEAREGEALEFRLALSQASEAPVSVDYETAEGTAHEGADYLPVSGTVSFAPGETVKTVAVATLSDGNAESAETLILQLSNAEGATLATAEVSGTIEASTGANTFTGAFSAVPSEHDGTNEFTLTLTFDEEPEGLSFETVRDSLFTRAGGTIEGARRESAGSNKAFVLTVKPSGNEAVKLSLKAVPPCGQDKTVCTDGGSVLSGPLGVTVPGPAALSVADAEVQEGPGAVLEFVVSLDRTRHAPVSVEYATENGEAVAGDDYLHTAGTLTFSPGETRHTVSVPVLADEHDEDSETLTLKLTNPVGARIADGEAVGTIRNNGAIPKAWIARFGRTVAEQVLVAVEGRMRATPAPGVEVALAGERIGGQAEPGSEAERDARREEEARRDAQRFADWLRDETAPEEAQRRSRAVTPRDLQTGSSFALTSETSAKDLVSLWGRGAVSRFDGREGRLALDGEVVTGMLGADWTRGRWTTGLIVSHSAAEGGYSGAPGAGDGTGGRVEATLTGVFPWARHALTERLEAWGAAGYGQGDLTVTPKKPGTDEDGAALRADLELGMAAAGLRGVLFDPESGSGFQLTGKTDAMVVQTASGRGRSADGGNLAPARATVSRLRLGLEGSRPIRLGGGATLTPSLETGVRHDDGDAETGFGLDLGGGLTLSDPGRGLEAELRGRGLLAHESKDFRERGFSGSLAWEGKPSSDRGAKLTLTQTVGGTSSGGADALLARGTLEGLTANDNGGGNDDLKSRRLELKLGYGLSAFGGRFTWTPEAGAGLSDTGRDYSLGWRLVRSGSGSYGGSLEFSFEARRRESANDDTPPVHEVGFGLTARF